MIRSAVRRIRRSRVGQRRQCDLERTGRGDLERRQCDRWRDAGDADVADPDPQLGTRTGGPDVEVEVREPQRELADDKALRVHADIEGTVARDDNGRQRERPDASPTQRSAGEYEATDRSRADGWRARDEDTLKGEATRDRERRRRTAARNGALTATAGGPSR